MEMFQWLVFAAIAATIVALGGGIFAMASHAKVGNYDSATWMNWRVAFQAVACSLVIAAVYADS